MCVCVCLCAMPSPTWHLCGGNWKSRWNAEEISSGATNKSINSTLNKQTVRQKIAHYQVCFTPNVCTPGCGAPFNFPSKAFFLLIRKVKAVRADVWHIRVFFFLRWLLVSLWLTSLYPFKKKLNALCTLVPVLFLVSSEWSPPILHLDSQETTSYSWT